ncbi:hypothetical protein [Sphingobium sp. MK2]|uniref:hypothetical protein n=1 Tax=Sphingobium sp. MK2 TaxID=3116540 RepID=UPI0032E36700
MTCRLSPRFTLPLLLTGALLTGCGPGAETNNVANATASVPTVETIEDSDAINSADGPAGRLPTDDWIGRWTGPEGLFLDIQPAPDGKPGSYALTNKDTLDRQGDYAGMAEGPMIRFTRDGVALTIRPGTGAETGFKYLADKTDCLIVVAGQEGYCR